MKIFMILAFALAFQAQAKNLPRIEENKGKVKVLIDVNMVSSSGNDADILFVVDNSGSMYPHQNNLAQAMPSLIKNIVNSGVNFQAGVITTDSGYLHGFPEVVTALSSEPELRLARNVKVGMDGSPIEMVFDSIFNFLKGPQKNSLLRPGSHLELIIVTDAEDQSDKADSAALIAQLRAEKNNDIRMVSASGLIVPSGEPDSSKCPRDMGNVEPQKIEKFISDLGGSFYSLCDGNMAENLKAIAQKISDSAKGGLRPRPSAPIEPVELPSRPVVESITVNYGTQVLTRDDLSQGWSYDLVTGKVTLAPRIDWSVQPEGTPLEITYVPLNLK